METQDNTPVVTGKTKKWKLAVAFGVGLLIMFLVAFFSVRNLKLEFAKRIHNDSVKIAVLRWNYINDTTELGKKLRQESSDKNMYYRWYNNLNNDKGKIATFTRDLSTLSWKQVPGIIIPCIVNPFTIYDYFSGETPSIDNFSAGMKELLSESGYQRCKALLIKNTAPFLKFAQLNAPILKKIKSFFTIKNIDEKALAYASGTGELQKPIYKAELEAFFNDHSKRNNVNGLSEDDAWKPFYEAFFTAHPDMFDKDEDTLLGEYRWWRAFHAIEQKNPAQQKKLMSGIQTLIKFWNGL